ncbi:MAG TPA: TolC family protein [Fibrobacteria bacterium]|nr:TolC family protein [Fibrobacteria bacterium]
MTLRASLLIAIAALSSARGVCAQVPILSLQEAIQQAVGNNFGLDLARDQTDAAAANRAGGVGAFLPSANANLSHGGPLPPDGTAPATSVGASANWIVFDGFQNYNGYRRLQSQEKAARLQERLALESLLETVVVSYYDLVQQKQRLTAINELLAVSLERARLAQAKLEVGAGSKLDQLQSLADLNEDSSAYLNQNVSLQRAKVRLNQVLARDPALDFDVADSIPLETSLPLDAWRKGLSENNASIAEARAQKTSSAFSVGEARGRWLPSVGAGVSYVANPSALNSSRADAGRDGFAYSVNLSVPLFDRLATPTAVRQAKLNLRGDETRLRQAESQAAADFEQARRQYETSLRQTQLEERNLQVARLQAEAAQERYKLGASSPLEFRDAQTRLLDAEGRLITARQSAKQSEAALQRLAGVLVKQAPQAAPAGGK